MKTNSRNQNLLKKSFILAAQNIWRNKLISISTIAIISIILFINNLILAVNQVSQEAINTLNEKIDITIYFKENTNSNQITQIQTALQNLPEVKNTEFISKEQALQTLQTNTPKLAESFIKYNLENPLPASLRITTQKPADHQTVVTFLNQDQYLAYLSQINSNQNENGQLLSSISNNLIKITNYTKQTLVWVILTFFIGGTLIVANALQISIYHRKQDLEIMQLVGAKIWFIKSPFIIEAIIYATTAVLLTTLVFTNSFQTITFKTFIFQLLIVNTIAITSAQIATHRQLK